MFNFRILYLFFLLVYTILVISCASVSSPSGGPKDITPPEINKEKSFPADMAVNYKDKFIELTFNEDISAPAIAEQLLITPLEENPYKVIQKKNKIRLEFEKDFQANTTYTFNFREAIKDITEGNTSKNSILSFSTGPYLDSIFVSGKVIDLLSNQPRENILLSLYKTEDTLSPLKSKPIYFTKSDKGNYIIKNIKQGNYRLYAIDDKNKNLLLDDREKLAFLENLNLDSSQKNINLYLSPFDNKTPKVKYTKTEDEVALINLSKGIEKASLYLDIPGDTTMHFLFNLSRDGKTINIYKTYEYYDSIPLRVELTDSAGVTVEEKTKILFEKDPRKEKKKEGFLVSTPDKNLNPGESKIKLIFNKPVIKYDPEKLFIKADTTINKVSKENLSWPNNTSLDISIKNKAKDSLILIMEEGAFSNFDTINKKNAISFNIKKEEDYGIISGQVKTKEENIIVELLDKNYVPVITQINKKMFNYTFLPPGTYYIRVISDLNKNRRWDGLNLKEKQQPESVHFYKEKIELRANWEIQDLLIEF